MNQKKIGNKLYVFSETAYEITQDTDASVILIQQECIDAYKALNNSAVNAKIKSINYKLFCVQTQEWMDYYNDLTVTVGTIVGGTVTASPTSADEGEEITLTQSASTGYEFTSWNVKDADNNSVTVTNNKFAMPASNVTVNAVFDKIDFDITIDNTIQNGTLSAPATANLGDTVTITATPSAGYKLDTLTVMCGSLEVTVVNSQFTMPAGDVTITGTFAQSKVERTVDFKLYDAGYDITSGIEDNTFDQSPDGEGNYNNRYGIKLVDHISGDDIPYTATVDDNSIEIIDEYGYGTTWDTTIHVNNVTVWKVPDNTQSGLTLHITLTYPETEEYLGGTKVLTVLTLPYV